MISPHEDVDRSIAEHVFSVSAALVGVCLTVIGLFQLSDRLQKIANIGDKLVAVNAIFFLSACFFSYMTLKSKKPAPRKAWERFADFFFLSGLLLMVVIGALVAHALI